MGIEGQKYLLSRHHDLAKSYRHRIPLLYPRPPYLEFRVSIHDNSVTNLGESVLGSNLELELESKTRYVEPRHCRAGSRPNYSSSSRDTSGVTRQDE